MYKQLLKIALLLMTLTAYASIAYAAESNFTTGNWTVEHYTNADFAGSPTVQTVNNPSFTPEPLFDGPLARSNASSTPFSERWSGSFVLAEASHIGLGFHTPEGNNQLRVWLDGQVIMSDVTYQVQDMSRFLQAGAHTVVVEYQYIPGPARNGLAPHSGGAAPFGFSAYSLPDAAPVLRKFTVSPGQITPDTTQVTVSWQVDGIDTVQLEYGPQSYVLPPSGTRTFTHLPSQWTAVSSIMLSAAKPNMDINGSSPNMRAVYALGCTSNSWFFSGAPSRCPHQKPEASPMQIQYFERGVMIMSPDNTTTYAMLDNDPQPRFSHIPGDTPADLDSNPDLTAPAGKLKPLGEFGRMWNQTREGKPLRDLIGWAIAPSVPYSGFVQCLIFSDQFSSTGECYIATPTDQIYVLHHTQSWELITRPVTAQRGSVPITPTTPTQSGNNDNCVIPPSGPWPACAKNGGGQPSTPTQGGNDNCVIPPSGPWPACAKNGGGQPSTPPSGSNGNGNCAIPPSGPWPACATAGDAPPPDLDSNCQIPPSGRWPACARRWR